jgi:hypothetical protein
MRRPGVLRSISRAVASLLLLGAVAGMAAGGTWWPAAERLPAPPLRVDVAAGSTRLVCPGPPRLVGQEARVSHDPEFGPAPRGSRTVVTGFSLGRADGRAATGHVVGALAEGGKEQPFAPAGGAAAHVALPGPQGPGLLEAGPQDDAVALLAGLTMTRTEEGDLRGLVAQRCLEPGTSAWLMSGSTTVGSSARLVLANPGPTPATVRLEAWGSVGPVDLGQAGEVLVPAREERSVLLESVAPDQARLAVHLTVDAGQVAAFVQHSTLAGFVPAGVDLVAPSAEPGTSVLVPGLVLPETDIDATDAALLRVANPGAEPARVRLRLLNRDGETTVPGAAEVVVEAETVADISLAGVPAGAYAAELDSDQPVTATGMVTRVGRPSRDDPDHRVVDRAWIPGVRPLPASLVPLPAGPGRLSDVAVVVSNAGEQPLDLALRVVRPGGRVDADALTVPARSTVVLDGELLAGAVGLELAPAVARDREQASQGSGPSAPTQASSFGHVAAAVLLADAADGELVSVVSAQPDLEAERTVPVRLPYR